MSEEAEKLLANFTQLDKLILQQSQRSLEEHQATVLQFSVLSYIKEHSLVQMGKLADDLRMSISSATQLVERLAKMNYIERTIDPEDRRIVKIALTEEGKKHYVSIRKDILSEMERVFANIPEKDRKELLRITDELIITMREKV